MFKFPIYFGGFAMSFNEVDRAKVLAEALP